MIKTKIIDLINSTGVLQKISNEPLQVATSYKIAKITKAVQSELDVYNTERLKLCEQYGKKNEDTGNYDIAEDKQTEFNAKFSELVSQEVELPCNAVDITNESIKLSANELIALDNLIIFEEDNTNA